MQAEFLTNKDNFIKLYTWIKENIGDVVILDRNAVWEFDESELYRAEVSYYKVICFTTKEFVPHIKKFYSEQYYNYSVELCHRLEVYMMDFDSYDLQKADDGNIPLKLYRHSYYSSYEETKVLKSIYSKIASKIRRNSIYIANRYCLLKLNKKYEVKMKLLGVCKFWINCMYFLRGVRKLY